MTVSFKTDPQSNELSRKIAEHAVALKTQLGEPVRPGEKDQIWMSILACHVNDTPLPLAEMLKMDDESFLHDVFGIHRHISKTTGKLEKGFMPRILR